MKPITFPPTENDAVLDTLKRSKELAKECDAEKVVVSYDLAIAKIGKRIQCAEHPRFENIFIQFGQFHSEINVFASLGKLIEGSGGPYILGEAGVIAIGSINKLLKGKIYNRCRRCHLLLSTALHGMNFEKLIDDFNISSSTLTAINECLNTE